MLQITPACPKPQRYYLRDLNLRSTPARLSALRVQRTSGLGAALAAMTFKDHENPNTLPIRTGARP